MQGENNILAQDFFPIYTLNMQILIHMYLEENVQFLGVIFYSRQM